MNADDVARLREAEARGEGPFRVDPAYLEKLAARPGLEIAELLINRFLPLRPPDDWVRSFRSYLGDRPETERVEAAVVTLMQSAAYQLS